MTADLVDRLAQEIRSVDGWHSLGAGALAEALAPFVEREAASALRSSGEAVACYGMRRKGTQAIIGMVPAKVHANPPTAEWYVRDYEEVPLCLHPATPASAWRPIAEAPRDGTAVILGAEGHEPVRARWGWEAPWIDGWWCDGHRSDAEGPGFEPTHFQPLPTPPTSTKGG